jgi:hypothetical protein
MANPAIKQEGSPADISAELTLGDWKEKIWTWFVEDTVAKDQHIGDVLVETWGGSQDKLQQAWAPLLAEHSDSSVGMCFLRGGGLRTSGPCQPVPGCGHPV